MVKCQSGYHGYKFYHPFDQNLYQNRPLELVRIIQNCLLKENELVKQHESINNVSMYTQPMVCHIDKHGVVYYRCWWPVHQACRHSATVVPFNEAWRWLSDKHRTHKRNATHYTRGKNNLWYSTKRSSNCKVSLQGSYVWCLSHKNTDNLSY